MSAGPGLGNVLQAAHLDAIHDVHEHPRQESHEELGHQRVDVGRDDGIQHGGEDEQLRDGEVQHFEPHDGQQRREHHESGVQDVVAGDDARAMAFGAALTGSTHTAAR